MKRSVLFVSLLLSLILSNPAANSVMAATADPFSVQSGVEAAVNKEAAENSAACKLRVFPGAAQVHAVR